MAILVLVFALGMASEAPANEISMATVAVVEPKGVEVLPGEPVSVSFFLSAGRPNRNCGFCRPFVNGREELCWQHGFPPSEDIYSSRRTEQEESDSVPQGQIIEFNIREWCDLSRPGEYEIGIRCVECPGLGIEFATIEILEPTRYDDREVWRRFVISCGSVKSSCFHDHGQEILESYPLSLYAGYALEKGWGAFPYGRVIRDWDDKAELVLIIGDGWFLDEHPDVLLVLQQPEVRNGRWVKTKRLPSRFVVKRHYDWICSFLAEHPGFSARDKLELMVSLDALVLGRPHESLERLNWVVENTNDDSHRRSACEYLAGIEQTGLAE